MFNSLHFLLNLAAQLKEHTRISSEYAEEEAKNAKVNAEAAQQEHLHRTTFRPPVWGRGAPGRQPAARQHNARLQARIQASACLPSSSTDPVGHRTTVRRGFQPPRRSSVRRTRLSEIEAMEGAFLGCHNCGADNHKRAGCSLVNGKCATCNGPHDARMCGPIESWRPCASRAPATTRPTAAPVPPIPPSARLSASQAKRRRDTGAPAKVTDGSQDSDDDFEASHPSKRKKP